jgi:hypothetical protein
LRLLLLLSTCELLLLASRCFALRALRSQSFFLFSRLRVVLGVFDAYRAAQQNFGAVWGLFASAL